MLREMARAHTEDAIRALVECLGSPKGSDRIAAAVALLNRGYGMPAQTVGGSDDMGPVQVVLSWLNQQAQPAPE